VRFQVLTAATMKFRIVFWDVLPCKIIVDRRFRGTCCLIPDDGGSTYLWNVGRQLFWNWIVVHKTQFTPPTMSVCMHWEAQWQQSIPRTSPIPHSRQLSLYLLQYVTDSTSDSWNDLRTSARGYSLPLLNVSNFKLLSNTAPISFWISLASTHEFICSSFIQRHFTDCIITQGLGPGWILGRVMAQTIRRQSLTAEALDWARVSPCGICGEK
jgi:hypothetical protein